MDLEPTIADATREIFQSMLMMEVLPAPPLRERPQSYCCSVSGMVGMAGLYRGMVAIHAPDAVAKTITGNFLGMEVDEINGDVKDAFGELANMLAGSIKALLSAGGKDIQLSIPSAICGEEYQIDWPPGSDGVMVPFSVAEGTFLVELQLQKQG
ncbi:MAG: chemotaxis protein CheX [Trichloromonadaceae bacterium]